MNKKEEIKVSIIMITYGHEKFIEKALKGVYSQQTTFPIELIIANDCSPDETDKIVKELMEKAPKNVLVRYKKNLTNKGANQNFFWALSQIKGQYIALCEGDDYWTDPFKLQKQVDFLLQNPDYALTFHSSTLLQDNKVNLQSAFSKIENRDYSQTELFTNWLAATGSLVFKKEIVNHPTYKAMVKEIDLIFGDNLLIMSSFLSGKVRGISDNMAVYRKHSEGMSYNLDRALLTKLTKQNILFGKYFPELRATLPTIIANRYFTHLKIATKSAKINDIFYFLLKYLKVKTIKQY